MRRRVLAKPLAIVAAPADTTAPTVPTNVTASSVTATGFTLSWTASTDAVGVTGYVVQIDGVTYATPTTTSVAVTGRSASSTYAVRVQARDAAGNFSALSTAINVTTSAAADVTAPTVPTNVATSAVTATGFTVSWTASTDAVGVTAYDVQIDGTSYATPTGTSVAVTGRAASITYSVRVRARDAAGNFSALSTAITVTTSAAAIANLFSTQTPSTTDASDGQGITLSTRFVSDIDGSVTGMRFYRAATAPTSAIGLVYSDAGTELVRATFGTLTTGWNTVTFGTPLAVTQGTPYRVAYWSSGPYVASSGFFNTPVINGHLTGTGGFFGYGETPASGTNQFGGGGYFADVLFAANAATAPTTPAAPSVLAGSNAVSVSWVAPSSNGGSAITGYDIQPFAGATGGAVTSVGNVTSATVTGLTNGTAYTVKIRAVNAVGPSAYSTASASVTPNAAAALSVAHGDQLTIAKVGPWSLQGVAKGSEVLASNLPLPSRGYWRFEAPEEFAPTGAWPSNANDSNPSILNSPSLHGGVVTGSPVTIDGYVIPVGTWILQFTELPDDREFYAQGTSLKVLFRGCRFRWTNGMSGIGIFNDAQSTTAQQIMLHYCDIGLRSADPPDGSESLMHIKLTAGRDHRLLRNYHTLSATFIQPNTTGVEITENYIDNYLYGYGSGGTAGVLPNPNAGHLNGVSTEGGITAIKILRNRIVAPSPDGATGSTGTALGHIGFGTQPGQDGYGAGTEPGRIVSATDNIAIFTNGGDNPGDATTGIQIRDNYLGGTAWCVYAGGTNATNVKLTGNKFTTRWWTNAGFFGPVAAAPAWGANGNVQSNNVWADDYGNGGDGNTAPANRQYPAGNGPRTGTSV